MRKYHTLVAKDGSPGCPWGIAFGDYDLETVKAERDDYRDNGWKSRELKIITTSAKQADIDAAVAALNGESTNA